jgi:hypothetical protein
VTLGHGIVVHDEGSVRAAAYVQLDPVDAEIHRVAKGIQGIFTSAYMSPAVRIDQTHSQSLPFDQVFLTAETLDCPKNPLFLR